MRVTSLQHSCLLVETRDARVLVDPGIFSSGSAGPDALAGVLGLDAVLVTHQHADHVDVDRLPGLLAGSPGARVLAEPQTVPTLGGTQATAFEPGQSVVLGDLTVRAVGGEHAVIHADVPRVGNVGLLLTEDGGPTVFHPGDAIDVVPEGVDVLALPVAAPWSALKETVDFLRAVAPARWFAIHDALLAPPGRGIFLRLLNELGPGGAAYTEAAGAGPLDL